MREKGIKIMVGQTDNAIYRAEIQYHITILLTKKSRNLSPQIEYFNIYVIFNQRPADQRIVE